jgi:MscS family membrane protein
MNRSFLRMTLILVVLLGAAWAQEAAAPAVDLSSPRATLKTFYEAMVGVEAGEVNRLDAALACLHLEEVPAGERSAVGDELAQELFEELDRLTFSFEDIPEELSGTNYVAKLGRDPVQEFRLHRYEDGAWRFSYSGTLAKLEENAAATEEAPVAAEGTSEFDPRLESPRATMKLFISGFSNWKRSKDSLDDILYTLDLSEMPGEVRRSSGLETGVRIKRVLDRHEYIEYTKIHNDPNGAPYTFLTHPAGHIRIAPVEDPDSGMKAWRFTAASVASARALWDAYQDEPFAEGITRDNTPPLYSLIIRDRIHRYLPFLLKRQMYLENWQWLGLFLIILAGMLLSRLVGMVIVLGIRKWFRRENLTLDKKLEKDFVRPIRIALMAWVWLLGLSTLGLPPMTLLYLRIAAKAISAGGLVWAAYRLIDILGEFLMNRAEQTETRFDDIIVPLVTRSLKMFIVVFGVVFVAESAGFQPTSVLAGLGLGGLAFALAAKDTVANIFGSVTIVLDRPFQIGDWICVGDVDGNVESVGIRSTRVRTFYNSLITVPNSELTNATIDNYGMRRYRRIKTMLSVAYDTPPEKMDAFCEGIRELIRQHPYTRKDYYHVYFNEFGDASLNILLYCFHECPDWSTELRERHRLFLDITRLAKRLGIEFAFPTQTLYLRKEEFDAAAAHANAPAHKGAALARGREVAGEIVGETLGRNAPAPPPVSFDSPDMIDAPLRDQPLGGDDGA